MDKKQNDLVKYVAIGGAVAAGYFIVNYLASRSPKPKGLRVQVTRRILKEVKYQMISNCISFGNGAAQKLKSEKKERDLEIGLRTQLANLLQGREDAVLKKYQISREQYSWSLEQHSKDKIVRGYTTQIMDMLEKAIKGQIPDLSVPEIIKRTFRDQECIQIYRGMIIEILQKLWEQIEDYRKQNPNFNSKNDRQFQAALKGFSIYDVKVSFLQKKGFKPEWGCPNELFLKVIETIKINHPQLKKLTLKIERAYEKMMTEVTTNSQNLSKQRIQLSYKETQQENPVNPLNASLANRAQPQIIPKKVQNPFTNFNKAKLPPPPPKYNEEEELQRMMMQQLMNRSQQLPEEQNAQEPLASENGQQLPEEQKIEEVKAQQITQQVKEQKAEQVGQPKEQIVNQTEQNISEQPKPEVVEVAIPEKVEENVQQEPKVDPIAEIDEQSNVSVPQEPEVAPQAVKQAEITQAIETIENKISEQAKPEEGEQLKKQEVSEEEKPVVENDHN